MNARDGILGRIRASNHRAGPVSVEQATRNAERIAAHRPNLIPARAEGDAATLTTRFVAFAEEVAATVNRVADADDVPAAVATFLASHNLPTELVASPDPALDAYPWAQQPLLTLQRRAGRPEDVVSITGAVLGIAETGSLMVRSGAKSPQTLHFMPPNHIAVLRAKDIVGSYEIRVEQAARAHGGRRRTLPAAHGDAHHRPVAHLGHREDVLCRHARAAQAPHHSRRWARRLTTTWAEYARGVTPLRGKSAPPAPRNAARSEPQVAPRARAGARGRGDPRPPHAGKPQARQDAPRGAARPARPYPRLGVRGAVGLRRAARSRTASASRWSSPAAPACCAKKCRAGWR